ncbi:MAG: DUF4019 domain-containing protein [Gemmatimonadetes bacterium]|nr:DUF4019 domain-containing protein [Gemmatimonadota bacterium]
MPDAPEQAARDWLALVDSGRVQESWEAAAAFFRRAVGPDEWAASLAAVRPPLRSSGHTQPSERSPHKRGARRARRRIRGS